MDQQTTPKQSSGLAIAGLVLGIIAAVTSFLPIINNLSFFIALVGGVLAIIALVGALRGHHTAKGLSIAGVVLAVVSIVIVLVTQSAYSAALNKVTEGSKPVAASSSSEATSSSASSSSSSEAPKNEEKPKEPAKDYSNLAVGETVALDNGLSVTVNSVEPNIATYGDKKIVGVNVTYKNDGKDSQSFNPYDWKGEDANGAQRSTTFYMDAKDELNSGKLSAGGSVTGNIYFEDGTVKVLYYSNMFNDSAAAGWKL
ncbi:MAG: DUF4190 and DUF4352 domain-containing protein [Atopobiaceae bacterium]|nr:DUF4190 and DUF4352 domain-containing protein [Atopobiaceae bacterium]